MGVAVVGKEGGRLPSAASDGGDSVFPAITACGNSEFPTGNKPQLLSESGPQADSLPTPSGLSFGLRCWVWLVVAEAL